MRCVIFVFCVTFAFVLRCSLLLKQKFKLCFFSNLLFCVKVAGCYSDLESILAILMIQICGS